MLLSGNNQYDLYVCSSAVENSICGRWPTKASTALNRIYTQLFLSEIELEEIKNESIKTKNKEYGKRSKHASH